MTPPPTRQLLDAGAAHLRAGRLREAADLYQQVLTREPNNAEALANLGSVALQANRPDQAAELLTRAAQLRPDVAEVRYPLAAALRAMGRWPEALAQYRQAAALRPGSAHAICDVATTLGAMGREDEAAAEYRKALALDPDHAMANYNLGVGLQKQGRFSEAADALRRATRRAPDFAVAHNNLGSVLRELGEAGQAVESYRRAIALQPNDPRYHNNLALALQDLGRLDDALASFDQSLRLRPDYAKARAFRSLALLLTGDYARGLAEYEARREIEGHFADRSAGRPQWDGSDPAGKTVLLHAEQGLGDTIHFVRYAPLLAARGARVVVQCQPPLKSLLEASLTPRGVWRVVADGEAVPEFDLHCPLPGLPHRFGTRVETIPADVPYLTAPPERVDVWRRQIEQEETLPPSPGTPGEGGGEGRPPIRVGIAWAGAPGNRNDRRRSGTLGMFEPLARVPGVRLYSLQKGETAAADLVSRPAGMAVEGWGNRFTDFADTAAAVTNLDLVVCVDTSVAHLAGALGKRVWTLLPFAPDWRWMLGRADSPWYPTMRLFRQPAPGDWSAVFEAVESALRALVPSPVVGEG
jgi:tetratricopeptide (TPR) repeat protein